MAKGQTQGKKEGPFSQEEIAESFRLQHFEQTVKINAEIARHEAAFEDYIGGICKAEPDFKPTALHEMRVAADMTVRDPESLPSELEAAYRLLAGIKFIYPNG